MSDNKLINQGVVYVDPTLLPEYKQDLPELIRRDEVVDGCGYVEGKGYVWIMTDKKRVVHVPVREMLDRVYGVIMAHLKEDGSADPSTMDRTIYHMHALFDTCVACLDDVGNPLPKHIRKKVEFALKAIEKRWRTSAGGNLLRKP